PPLGRGLPLPALARAVRVRLERQGPAPDAPAGPPGAGGGREEPAGAQRAAARRRASRGEPVKSTGAASRHPELRIRRPLVRPSSDARRVLRLVRGLPRHALALGALLVVLCMARVWLRLETVNLGYELSSARQMQLRLEHERQALEGEIATLRDPARVADIARRRLRSEERRVGKVVVLP